MQKDSIVSLDKKRFNYYYTQMQKKSDSSFPIWDVKDSISNPPVELTMNMLGELVDWLSQNEWLVHHPITAADAWFSEQRVTPHASFRIETATACQIHILGSKKKPATGFWWVEDQSRVLCLWENHHYFDPYPSRSRDHTIADRFASFYLNYFVDNGLDWQKIIVRGLDKKPLELFSELGATISSPQKVTLFYRLHHVCYPVTGRPMIVAAFGVPIAIWKAAGQINMPNSYRNNIESSVRIFLTANRWSEIQKCLETSTDALWDPDALKVLDTFVEDSDDPALKATIEQRKQLLLSAHRLGLLGAYAYLQGYGRRFIIDNTILQELYQYSNNQSALLDLFDRHPELIRIYRNLIGQDTSIPWSPTILPAEVDMVFQKMIGVNNEKSYEEIIRTLGPLSSVVDSRLYPGLCGNLRLRLAVARAAIADTEQDFADALADFDAAQIIFTADRFPIDCAETNFYLGSALMKRGHAKEAVDALSPVLNLLGPSVLDDGLLMAVASRSETEAKGLRAKINFLFCQALWNNVQWDTAFEHLHAIEQEAKLSDPDVAAQACLFLSDFEMERQGVDPDQRMETSMRTCQRGLGYIEKSAHNKDIIAKLHMKMAQLLMRPEGYGYRERLREAEDHIELALKILDENLMPDVFAHGLLIQHQYLMEAKPIDWQIKAYECAQRVLRIAHVLSDKVLEANAFEALAEVSDSYKAKIELLEHAVTILAYADLHHDRARIIRRIGDLHFQEKQWELAYDAYKKAIVETPPPKGHVINALEDSARTSAFYPRAAYAAAKLQRFDDALVLLENGKARFLKFLTNPQLIAKIDIELLLSLVPKDGALIVPILSEDGAIIFIIPAGTKSVTAKQVISSQYNSKTALELMGKWMNSYFKFARTQDFDFWEREIEQVCQILWNELMSDMYDHLIKLRIRKAATVLLVPPNMLAPLPLHAARNPEGQYPFSENYHIAYSPSLALLHASPKKSSGTQPIKEDVFAIINPNNNLPFATYELDALKRYVPSSQLKGFSNDDATTDKVFMYGNEAKYLHFACHGFNNWLDPLKTGVALHDAGIGATSFLPPNIDLTSAELVTLSACETGVTTALRHVFGNTATIGGEEYVGLPGALLAAGVKHIFSTLWRVEDYVAILFVEEFYRCLLIRMKNCHAAMSNAQDYIRKITVKDVIDDTNHRLENLNPSQDLAKQLIDIQNYVKSKYESIDAKPFNHPYHWAAYVLNGYHHEDAKSS